MDIGWKGSRLCFLPIERDRHFRLQYHWINDPKVTEWTDVGDYPVTAHGIEAYLNSTEITHEPPQTILFAIEKLDGKFIGLCDIRHINYISGYGEIGYIIGDKEEWGQGYGTEIVSMLVKYCFDIINLRTVTAKVLAPNIGSGKVLEKNGFQKCACIPKYEWRRGDYRDVFWYYLQKA